ADRHPAQVAEFVGAADAVHGGADGGLGGAVVVEQVAPAAGQPLPGAHVLDRHLLAADHHDLDRPALGNDRHGQVGDLAPPERDRRVRGGGPGPGADPYVVRDVETGRLGMDDLRAAGVGKVKQVAPGGEERV